MASDNEFNVVEPLVHFASFRALEALTSIPDPQAWLQDETPQKRRSQNTYQSQKRRH
eukprot:CAMPEP_0172920194 /NCGR_PEP_ID=MMETSP1075-20121228/203614_1 /TAXON_ID=2916 /ORGANISM="Ceratium fusus, Strain PA161109" /LENGTH=56 /DNA_ID=CAMNT_0013780173 /DNA_START=179 /DNA_END=346 /DNA_ORIENTATION=+